MIISNEIKLKYDYFQPYIETLGRIIDQTLFNYCQENHFAYSSRYKTLDSIAEKIETGRFSSWSDLDDLFAATIVIPNLKFEDEVIKYLISTFEQVEIKKRGTDSKDPQIFRFSSTRFVGKYKPKGSEDNIINDIGFEIQIRTAFEHAWTVATHSLSYKTDEIDWRIFRLTAQLKSSVEQLDMLISGYDDIYKHITKHKWPLIDKKIELIQFIKQQISNKKIPNEHIPKDLSRFCDNIINFVYGCNQQDKFIRSNLLSKILSKIDSEFSLYNITTFPRSISLFQLIVAIIIRDMKIIPDPKKYILFVTPELESFFPDVKKVQTYFKFE